MPDLSIVPKPKPILFVSDSISASSGLGRITRDLASRVHQHLGHLFRVGTAGYGGAGSRKYPWADYHFHSVQNWLLPELPEIAEDFAAGEELIVMFVWDASRLYWVGMPETCPIPHLRRWVETANIKKWVYGAIDAEGPLGKAPKKLVDTYKGFDRVLDYSAFSSSITGNPDHLPHGIDTSVFFPRDHKQARQQFIDGGFLGLTRNSLLLGVVATNQNRKNWQLAFETCRILLDRGHDVRLWAHTDVIERYWSLSSLIVDYGLQGRVAITTNRLSDEQLSWMYSACDVTLGIAPEGFGYPIAESLACGVPCVCGSYGAQAEFVPAWMHVDPVAYYYEGAFCSKRPVHSPVRWADKAEYVLGSLGSGREIELSYKVDWQDAALWAAWSKWFEEGAR